MSETPQEPQAGVAGLGGGIDRHSGGTLLLPGGPLAV
jgi:hypothetical protein